MHRGDATGLGYWYHHVHLHIVQRFAAARDQRKKQLNTTHPMRVRQPVLTCVFLGRRINNRRASNNVQPSMIKKKGFVALPSCRDNRVSNACAFCLLPSFVRTDHVADTGHTQLTQHYRNKIYLEKVKREYIERKRKTSRLPRESGRIFCSPAASPSPPAHRRPESSNATKRHKTKATVTITIKKKKKESLHRCSSTTVVPEERSPATTIRKEKSSAVDVAADQFSLRHGKKAPGDH